MNKKLGYLAALVQLGLAIGLAAPVAAAPSIEAEWAVSNQNGLRLAVHLENVAHNPAEAVVEYSLTNNSSAELTMHRVAGDDGTLFRLVAPNGTPMQPKVKPKGGAKYSKTSFKLAVGKTFYGQLLLSDHFDLIVPGLYRGTIGLRLYNETTGGVRNEVAIDSQEFRVQIQGAAGPEQIVKSASPEAHAKREESHGEKSSHTIPEVITTVTNSDAPPRENIAHSSPPEGSNTTLIWSLLAFAVSILTLVLLWQRLKGSFSKRDSR